MSHTPGPWRTIEDRKGRMLVGDDGIIVCDPYLPNPQDAPLIATAPELLAALKAVLSDLPETWGDGVRDGQLDYTLMEENIYAALEAIAKAEGRS